MPPADAPSFRCHPARFCVIAAQALASTILYFYSEGNTRKKYGENVEQCRPSARLPPSENEGFVFEGMFSVTLVL